MASSRFPTLAKRPVFTSAQVVVQTPKKEEPKPAQLLVQTVNYVPVVVAGKPYPVAYPVVVPIAQPVVFVNQPKMLVIDPLVRLAPHLVRF